MLREISFDYEGHRYAIRCHDGDRSTLHYQCDYKPCKARVVVDVLKRSKRDTSGYAKMLRLTN